MATPPKYSEAQLRAMLQFGTPRQCEYINSVLKSNLSMTAAAKTHNVHPTTLVRALELCARAAAKHGVAPDYGLTANEVPPGYYLGKSTIHRKADGEVIQSWDRILPDQEIEFIEAVKAGVAQALEDFEPLPCVPKRRALGFNPDIQPWYNIGDAHIGMVAYAHETGQDFTSKQCVRELAFAMTDIIRDTKPCQTCVINDLGDATHFENMKYITEGHGHSLDHDITYSDVIFAYIEVMALIIHEALKVHKKVIVVINQGNHSRKNDLWAAIALKFAFKDNPRVDIVDNRNVFINRVFGENQILIHHGDKCKSDKLINVMINDYREDYGKTKFHYIWTGHVHHRNTSNEFRGISHESFNNLADKDQHCHDGGWRSQQSLTRVDLHREYGEVGRKTLNIVAVRDMMRAKLKSK